MRTHKRWTEEDKVILMEGITGRKYNSTDDLLTALSFKLNRSMTAIHSYINKHHRDIISQAYTPLTTQLSFENELESDVEKLETIDSRSIFSMYEKLKDLQENFLAISEENSQLLQYYHRSEAEMKKLAEERDSALKERNLLIEHVNSIKEIISAIAPPVELSNMVPFARKASV